MIGLAKGGHARKTDAERLATVMAELEAARAELEHRRAEVDRLEVELEETNQGVVALYAELEEQAERLREANETKSRFLSNVSHEFRTPLNAMRALSGLLLERADGELTPEQEKQVAFIRQAAEELTILVNDLLDLAKIEAGRLDVHAEPFEVETLLRSLHGTLRPLLTNDRVRLVIEPEGALPVLDTDEGKLAQILRNLVSNALKFTTEGQVRLSVTRADVPGQIVFAVEDTGIGIAEADKARIFDEFVQVEGAHQAGHRGTGLGLPVSRRLAELLGGTITVASVLGEGSTFRVAIPAVHPSVAGRNGDVGAVVGGADTGAAPGPGTAAATWTVLVVDDDPAARYVVRSLLRPLDCRVVEAEGGLIALSVAGRLQPDLIVLDLQMPDLGGLEVLRRLRADASMPRVPVVVNTSRVVEEAEVAELAELGASVVQKGGDAARVLAAFRAALHDSPGPPGHVSAELATPEGGDGGGRRAAGRRTDARKRRRAEATRPREEEGAMPEDGDA